MRLYFGFGLFLSVLSAGAQSQNNLPSDLPTLLQVLPQLIHTHQFQLAPFADAADKAIKSDSASLSQAIPIFAQNLHDPDPNVRLETLALLVVCASQPNRAELSQPLGSEIASYVRYGNAREKRAAIGLAALLGPQASDDIVQALEELVQKPHEPDLIGAAQALMWTRPLDDTAQSDVLALMSDPEISKQTKLELIAAMGIWGVGSRIVENVVQLIEHSDDIQLRDAAITAAGHIGPPAVDRVRARLRQIEHDRSESADSRTEAAIALSAAAGGETYPMINGQPAPPEH